MTGNNRNYILQNRDRLLSRIIGMLRFVDREQAKLAAGFGSTTRINTRLRALVRLGLLKQFFVGTSVGTRKAIYALTRKGAAVADVRFRRVRFLEGRLIGSDLFLEHQLQLNSMYLSLMRTPVGVQMNNWRTFDDPLSPAINLKPDAYCELRSDVVRSVFVEVDMGTETRRIWQRKTSEYLKLAVTEEFERLFQQRQFRVLIVTTSERRLHTILDTVAKQTDKVFFGTTFNAINRESLWGSIWLRPGKPEKVSLL
jgi:hypothetical protein